MGLCFCHCIAENDILNADGSQVSKGSEEIGEFEGQHETCGMMLQVSRETKARKKEGKGRSLQVPSTFHKAAPLVAESTLMKTLSRRVGAGLDKG